MEEMSVHAREGKKNYCYPSIIKNLKSQKLNNMNIELRANNTNIKINNMNIDY